jgi:aminopeptidase-like protein
MNNPQQDIRHTLESYFDRLWPICRSITGNGLRESLKILSEIAPMKLTEIPTGESVFDWIVPKEWNITDAYIITPDGRRVAEFKQNNLHVVNYSIPVDQEMTWDELRTHIHSIPEMPEAIPYITSYYKENWGFCVAHEELVTWPKEGVYRVVIDSQLEAGHLTYGEAVLPGSSDEEILFSTYLCHPSMANNELSGPLAAALIYQAVAAMPERKYTYRFLFAPETIGVIAFLSRYGEELKSKLRAGYVLTCCGDPGGFTYKRSKHRHSLADRAAEHVLSFQNTPHRVIEFAVGGSDERQYCSPGFNLPVGSLMRTPYQQFKEYHTSLDNKSFISFQSLQETVEVYTQIVRTLELNACYVNRIAHCEPQLGKRGLYPSSVDPLFNREETHRLLHFLSFADGENDLIYIASLRQESSLKYESIIRDCRNANLI